MRIAIAHDIRDFVGWQSYSQTTKRLGDEVAYIRTDDCFAATYELHHLPMQSTLQSNIEMHFYTSGHMVYAHEPDLKKLHDNVAAFIDKTKNGK